MRKLLVASVIGIALASGSAGAAPSASSDLGIQQDVSLYFFAGDGADGFIQGELHVTDVNVRSATGPGASPTVGSRAYGYAETCGPESAYCSSVEYPEQLIGSSVFQVDALGNAGSINGCITASEGPCHGFAVSFSRPEYLGLWQCQAPGICASANAWYDQQTGAGAVRAGDNTGVSRRGYITTGTVWGVPLTSDDLYYSLAASAVVNAAT